MRSELDRVRYNSVRILGELEGARLVEAVARQVERDLDAAATALARRRDALTTQADQHLDGRW